MRLFRAESAREPTDVQASTKERGRADCGLRPGLMVNGRLELRDPPPKAAARQGGELVREIPAFGTTAWRAGMGEKIQCYSAWKNHL